MKRLSSLGNFKITQLFFVGVAAEGRFAGHSSCPFSCLLFGNEFIKQCIKSAIASLRWNQGGGFGTIKVCSLVFNSGKAGIICVIVDSVTFK